MHSLPLRLILFGLILLTQAATSASHPPKREIRAVWIATIGGLDWPSTYARHSQGIRQQQEELKDLLDSLHKTGINTILLQTRIRGTVIYPSVIEPWDGCLTGTPGRSPGYDPLSFAIDECHRRGMEIHAWVVAFPLANTTVTRQLGKQALPHKRPELCRRADRHWMMDPGVPGTADYLARICQEITQNYDIDGIHLDYIRYPEKEIPFNDAATYRHYGKGRNKADWRRDNVTRCVAQIHKAIKDIKPWVKLSCSPIGKADDLTRFSSRGWNAYKTVYQDAQGWLRTGLMDLLFPMMYFQGNHFYPFALDWIEQAEGCPIVPGLGIYFLDNNEKDWPLESISRQMHYLRLIGSGGQAYFRSRFLTNNVKGIYTETQSFYKFPALVPALKHKTPPPAPPAGLTLTATEGELRLTWMPVAEKHGEYLRYNVYRSDGYPVNTEDPRNLILSYLRKTECQFQAWLPSTRKAFYAVTAIDRYGNESQAAVCSLTPQKAQPQTTCLLTCQGDTLILPESVAPYVLIFDGTGRIIRSYPYRKKLNIHQLPPGCYQAATVNAKGQTIQLGTFAK